MNAIKWIIILLIAGGGGIYILKEVTPIANDSVKEVAKEGIEVKKKFDENGKLKADAEFVGGVRHGIAHNYYSNGKVHSEIFYKNGLKQGSSTWFFENGKPYRVTPFVNGKKHGIQKKYYESGKLLAEIPYENGKLVVGTKEFDNEGNIISDYPKIEVHKLKRIGATQKLNIDIFLSNKKKDVKFKVVELSNGREITLNTMNKVNERTRLTFMTKDANIKKRIKISTTYKTKLGNKKILEREYTFSY